MTHHDVITYLSRMDESLDLGRAMVVWDHRLIDKGESFDIHHEKITMPFRGSLVFIDLKPRANWAHPCLYVLLPENYTDYLKVGEKISQHPIKASFPPSWYWRQELPETADVIMKYGKEPEDGKNINPYQ